MKRKFYLVGMLTAAMMFASCNESTEEETNTQADSMEQETTADQTETEEVETEFGPKKVIITEAITTEELIKNFEGKTEMEATFKAEITEVCSKMGCWINVDKGDGETFMVRFKDHFTIPPATEPGTVAYLTGVAIQDTIPVDEQRHYLEDANASQEEIDAIVSPKYAMTFIAEGIKLEEK